jgi:hypothetical protein
VSAQVTFVCECKVYQILVVRCILATCGHRLVLYKSLFNLNQLDGIGTTVRNFKNPRN